ncbi:DUF4317 domain-containing protein [Hornefia butyriciproducens]|uniref:DUF4317 domain-containing protein n=1 Tax=Hornefia butyriciproducens TaxID=2652293 RepID=UPI0023F38D90|nr:DUF4317 domain-containing protein [Hornefia butyriciproducens]MDD6300040.1 DUF4317 domain-containing protein [Hornefia butyriciproducens]MDD7019761.1 DUF4317 domain-containing protein [Hornefia butyriciproducens]
MNQKELNEIRRRFKPDHNAISRIYGCYVNGNKEPITYIDTSLGLMPEEEQEMYLGLLKKSLSGALGRNLIDIEFSTAQVEDSEEHRLLQTVRQSGLENKDAREELCRRIIDAMDPRDTNYLILLASDTYDVPFRGSDGAVMDDASESVYQYFVCSVCPVKDPKLELIYNSQEHSFRSTSTGHIALAPELGFLFPAFDDRSANIYNALFYSKNPDEVHQNIIDALFHVDPPMSAEEQKILFDDALSSALQEDCCYDVVQSVHEQVRCRIAEHKESKDPEPLVLSIPEVGDVLRHSGVPAEKAEAFQQECRERYGEFAELNPRNIIESGKFRIETPDVKISVAPEYSSMIETRIIDGSSYILIPAGDGVEINGIPVNVSGVSGETEDSGE